MKNLLIALLVLSAAHVSNAADNSEKLAEITKMEAELEQMDSDLEEMRAAVAVATIDGTKATIRLSKHGAKSLLIGWGAYKAYELSKYGEGPFAAATESISKWDPSTGALVGWAPKVALKQVALAGVQVAEISTIVGGTLWSAMEAYYAVANGYVVVVNYLAIPILEGQVQVGQEKVMAARRNLRAVKATLE